MAKLIATSPLAGYDKTIGDMRLRELNDINIVSVAIPLKETAKVTKALKETLSLAMPKPAKTTLSIDKKMRAISTQADQVFLITTKKGDSPDTAMAKKLGGVGWATDQSDGWVVLELSGPSTRAALERICQVDLDAGAFPVNASARTSMEHLGSIIIRTDKDTFLLMSASSSAASFLHAVELSAQHVT